MGHKHLTFIFYTKMACFAPCSNYFLKIALLVNNIEQTI